MGYGLDMELDQHLGQDLNMDLELGLGVVLRRLLHVHVDRLPMECTWDDTNFVAGL